MVKSNIISAMKANRLYWLGRYEERVYLTLHLLRKCYDKMIDGDSNDYDTFWQKLDVSNNYQTEDEFKLGMMFDDQNVSSVFSSLLRAQDNAILLREDIMSETLSYIEMSTALMRRLQSRRDSNILSLQPVTDWTLAFWGSVQQRVLNSKARTLMYLGREIENMDFLLRFDYPLERVGISFNLIRKHLELNEGFYEKEVLADIESVLDSYEDETTTANFRIILASLINKLITI